MGDHYGGGKAQHGAAAFTRIPPIGAENEEEEEEGDGLGGSASNLEVSEKRYFEEHSYSISL